MQKTNFLNQQNNPNNNSTEISFDTQTQASSYSNSNDNKSLGINRPSVNTPTIHETEIIKKARAKENNKKRKKITFLVESERDSERER